jgi:hypothetical protein
MGITLSDLKDKSAFSVVGSFIITKSSFEYFLSNKEEDRKNAINKLIIGAFLVEGGKLLITLNKLNNSIIPTHYS